MNRLWILGLWLVLLLVGAVRYAEPVGDGDLFWQMAYGKQLLERGTLIPDHTIYSWTPSTNRTIYCSWVAEIMFYKLYQISESLGLDGLTLLFAFRYFCILIVLGMAWQYVVAIGASRRMESLLLMLVFMISSYVGTILKPEIFSLVFLSLTAWCIFSVKMRSRLGLRYDLHLWAIPIAMVLWVNSHGVYLFGLVGLGGAAVGEVLNRFLSPKLAMPDAALKRFLGAVGLTGVAILATPYGYRYPLQLVMEFLGMAEGKQSKGDAAAYHSLAAHMTIFQVPAFHFVDYMEFMAVVAMVAMVYIFSAAPDDPEALVGRIDFTIPILNLVFGAIYTWYLRTTFYWPPFFLYSILYSYWLVKQLRGGPPPAPVPPGFTPASGRSAPPAPSDPKPDTSPVDPGTLIRAAVVLGVTYMVAWYPGESCTFWWLPSVLYLGVELSMQPLGLVKPKAGHMKVPAAAVSLALFCFISSRSLYESVLQPYASSWCGFGITYWNPVVESDFIAKYHPDLTKIYNDYDSGGWLIWHLYPKLKVMIDPRSFPYRDWYKNYIDYEQGAHFKETQEGRADEEGNLDVTGNTTAPQFKDKPDVSIVSLKNAMLWRGHLQARDQWVPAYIGPSSVVFCRPGHKYPPDAANFAPDRFKDIKNSGRCLQVFQFAAECGLWDTAWQALDAMKANFHAPDNLTMVATLTDYKDCIQALQKNDLSTAIAKQESCRHTGLFYSNSILYSLYDMRIKQLMKEGAPGSNAEIGNLTLKMQMVQQGKDPNGR